MEHEDQAPSALIQLAIEQKVPVEVLERLVALHERVTERNAEVAMAEALAGFQAECPPVPRTRAAEIVKNGVKQYSYTFAPLDEIVRVIRPHLTKYQLSYVHDARVDKDRVEITCTLQHAAGAKRTATFEAPIDSSGGKNAIQQVGSARSYGRRYTLMDVLGLTTEDDDDGNGTDADGEAPRLSEDQVANLSDLIESTGAKLGTFLRWIEAETLADIPASEYDRAVQALKQRGNAS
jgi:hypothetical protein